MAGLWDDVTIGGSLTLTMTSPAGGASATPMSASAQLAVTGALVRDLGDPVSLTGVYDDVTRTLVVSGGGYVFHGTLAGGLLAGTFTGGDDESGRFAIRTATSAQPVTVFCGRTFRRVRVLGAFNLVITGSQIDAILVDLERRRVTPLHGRLIDGDEIWIEDPSDPGDPTATGQITGDEANGQFHADDDDGPAARWRATRC